MQLHIQVATKLSLSNVKKSLSSCKNDQSVLFSSFDLQFTGIEPGVLNATIFYICSDKDKNKTTLVYPIWVLLTFSPFKNYRSAGETDAIIKIDQNNKFKSIKIIDILGHHRRTTPRVLHYF